MNLKRYYLSTIMSLTCFFSGVMPLAVAFASSRRLPASGSCHYYGRWTRPAAEQSSFANHLGSMRGGGVVSTTPTQTFMLSPTLASVLAGSVAGAIGVGVAFPLDTLKTKSQVMRQQLTTETTPKKKELVSATTGTPSGVATMAIDTTSMIDQHYQRDDPSNMNMLQLMGLIWRAEGLAGFFGGVRAMMMGQALIKATAFSANTFALDFLGHYGTLLTSVLVLILAACFSGFVTSFLVAPVERVKVMMQASSGKSLYQNEIDCLKAVVKTEGWEGLLGRGLGPTLAREIPSYGIYFVAYGFLMKTALASWLGPAAPLVFGALSGCACWIPVYPIDVVKTLVQNTEGGGETKSTTWDVTKQLYQEGGISAFFDGLTPKMLRAAVNHSVTFFMYDLAMKSLTA